MSYELTKKQNLLQKNIRSLARQKFGPLADENDRATDFPYKAIDELAKNRLLGLLVPREEGGEGAGFLDVCLVLEGISKACPSSGLICSAQNLGTHLLSKEGTQAQKGKFLSGLLEGKTLFGYVLPEGVSLNLTNVPASFSQENNHYLVHSEECFVVNGDEAKLICIFAKKGEWVQCFFVEKQVAGLSMVRPEGLTGVEGRSTFKAVLENCQVPAENMIGKREKGQTILADLITKSSCFTGAQALGIAEGALDYAVEYSKQREQFGRSISEFQAIKIMLADMGVRVEAARHLIYKAGSALDEDGRDRHMLASIAKYFTSKMAMEVTTDALQVGGGYGYTKDYPFEKMMRGALLTQVLDGSNHSHQLFIAKCLLEELP
jgi:alkylation response protein AidB-like acyl-CoA dehydrogenase